MKDLRNVYARPEDFRLSDFACVQTPLQPAYAWVWDDEIDLLTVKCRLREMLDAGIRSFFILPMPKNYRPGQFPTGLAPDYLTEEYLILVRETFREAKRLGMNFLLYDEGGWPSGSACGQTVVEDPKLCRKTLDRRQCVLKEGEIFSPDKGFIAAFDKTNPVGGYFPGRLSTGRQLRRSSL